MRRIKILKILAVFWLFLFFLSYMSADTLILFFMSTLSFNIPTAIMLIVGTIIILGSAVRLTMLAGTFGIMAYKKGAELEYYLKGIDRIMPATIAHMFNNRAKKGVLYFTQDEAKDVVMWLQAKFSSTKDYITFFTNTSLMIGLLGTFSGLLVSIDKMGAIVLSLTGDINLSEVISGFAGPLAGMAVGFGSSIMGVIAAMVLGFQTYLISRSEEAFIEDIEDWLKGKIIESQGSDVAQQFNAAMATPAVGTVVSQDAQTGQQPTIQASAQSIQSSFTGMSQSQAKTTAGFVDVFVESIGTFTQTMEKYNKSNEVVYKMLSQSLEDNAHTAKEQGNLFENISSSLKELNINQFSSSMKMEESLQDISNVMIGEHRTVKQLVALQEQTNENLAKLIKVLEENIKK